MKIGQHWKIFWEVLRKSDIHIFFGHVSDFVHPFTIPSVCISRSIWSKIDYFPILSFDLVKSDWPFCQVRVSSTPTSMDLISLFLSNCVVCRYFGWFFSNLVNQNAGKQTKFFCQNFGLLKFKFNEIPKQTKILTNKPKFWQTNQNSSKQTLVCLNSNLMKSPSRSWRPKPLSGLSVIDRSSKQKSI